jgi:signal transduction histidine kinase
MSLTLRLSLTYLLVTLAGALLLGLGLVTLVERYLAAEQQRALAAQSAIYAALLGELAADSGALQAIAGAGLADDLLPPGTSARIFSATGALLAGDPALGPFPSRAALPLLTPPFPLPASQVAGRSYAASLVAGAAGSIGVVELSRPPGDDAGLLTALRGLTLQAALIAALAVGALSMLLARSIARPISALTRRAERLAAETLGAAAPARPGRDEIRQLAHSLDSLESGLRAYVARIGELEQSRSRFYRSVSHELRTPLTVIRGSLENLADAAPPEQRPAFDSLEAEAQRLSRLVDELLRPPADGRLLPAERRPLDLAALAAELGVLLAGRASRAGVRLVIDAPALVSVEGDRDRLKQALLNLLDNALRHTPPGGQVTLRVAGAAGRAQLSVEDDGPGVPTELGERIWERGVRGAAGPGAAGLGLPIVREIIAAHGGSVARDPAHQPGARFVISLPKE